MFEIQTRRGRGMKITSEGKQLESEPWYSAYQDFMAVLAELDNEKAPEIGATYDLFESLESLGQ